MAYIRTKGNQVLLVHGARHPDTGTVEQQTLFTFYTRAEVQAALGEHQRLFQDLVALEHPSLRLDWTAIDAGLREHLSHLPDSAPEIENTAAVEFRNALVEFTRVSWELDPYELRSAARLVQENRQELTLLVDHLRRLLAARADDETQFSRDSPSLWRQAAKSRSLPLGGWEQLEDLWDHGKYAEAEALARLLAQAFPLFADGHTYQGLAAMERNDPVAALAHFVQAESVGRKAFPRRIAKSRYWDDHHTRPFLRAVMHQVAAHNRMDAHANALAVCDRLQQDFGQDITADELRVPVLLNAQNWKEAARIAHSLVGLYPENHFAVALATWELRETARANEHFVLAALRLPGAAALLVGGRLPKGMDVAARDHNTGVGLLRDIEAYRRSHRKTLQHFKQLLAQPVVQAAVLEADRARQQWRADRTGDPTAYERLQRLETLDHARELVAQIVGGAGQGIGPQPIP